MMLSTAAWSLDHSVTPTLLLQAIPYRPFIDPLALHAQWWVFLPVMALGIAIVYKAVRLKDLTNYTREVVMMTVQIVLGMILLAVASYALVLIFATFVAGHRAG